jgi:hypothetical protein
MRVSALAAAYMPRGPASGSQYSRSDQAQGRADVVSVQIHAFLVGELSLPYVEEVIGFGLV